MILQMPETVEEVGSLGRLEIFNDERAKQYLLSSGSRLSLDVQVEDSLPLF
jgi:hypothetical protein